MKIALTAGLIALGLLIYRPTPVSVQATAHPAYNLPASAIQVGDGVYALGTKADPQSGRLVQGYAFVHTAKARGGNSNKPGGGSTCYAYLARGAKWPTPEPWLMNPANASGMNGAQVFAAQAAALEQWEDAADGVIGNGNSVQIFGSGTSTSASLSADTSAPDGLNEVYFANASGTGTIAVTSVWGVFAGPAYQRQLTEWDQVYDDVDFSWSLSGQPTDMDFLNIAVHEVGHAAGMGHPSDSCNQETMFRYASEGEIIKRDLNTGDISGINALY